MQRFLKDFLINLKGYFTDKTDGWVLRTINNKVACWRSLVKKNSEFTLVIEILKSDSWHVMCWSLLSNMGKAVAPDIQAVTDGFTHLLTHPSALLKFQTSVSCPLLSIMKYYVFNYVLSWKTINQNNRI